MSEDLLASIAVDTSLFDNEVFKRNLFAEKMKQRETFLK